MEEFFGLTFICMGNAIRSKKNTPKPFLTSPSPWGSAQTPRKSKGSTFTKVKIENCRIVLFDSSNEAS